MFKHRTQLAFAYGPRPTRLRCEALERRELLSVTPLGTHQRVSSNVDETALRPAVATHRDGSYAVGWSKNDGSAYNHPPQLRFFDKSGASLEIRVGTTSYTTLSLDTLVPPSSPYDLVHSLTRPDLAFDDAGNLFVVFTQIVHDNEPPPMSCGDAVLTWLMAFQGGSSNGTRFLEYVPTPRTVNTGVTAPYWWEKSCFNYAYLNSPRIAVTGDGLVTQGDPLDAGTRVVVSYQAWTDRTTEGISTPFSNDIWVRQMSFDGSSLQEGPAESKVNTSTTGSQFSADVAMDDSGAYTVTWTSTYESVGNPGGFAVYRRRFASNGSALTGELRVDQVGAPEVNDQDRASQIAVAPDGRSVIVWERRLPVVGTTAMVRYEVYYRQFDMAGNAVANEQRIISSVMPASGHGQARPAVAINDNGAFTVAWFETASTGAESTYFVARRFNWNGTFEGPDTVLNTFGADLTSAHIRAWPTVNVGNPGREDEFFAQVAVDVDPNGPAASSDLGGVFAWVIDDISNEPGGNLQGNTVYVTRARLADAGPRVTNVQLRRVWEPQYTAFSNFSKFDVEVPTSQEPRDGRQLKTVGVSRPQQVRITFDQEILASTNSLQLVEATTGTVLTPASYVNLQSNKKIGVWTFAGAGGAAPIPVGQWTIVIDDALVTNTSGGNLDGEWRNPESLGDTSASISSYPSGDGEEGGDFRFRITMLRSGGDANRDNIVGLADYSLWQSWFGQSIVFSANGEVSELLADFNGDATVGAGDLTAYSASFGRNYTAWPGGGSGAATGAAVAAVTAARVEPWYVRALDRVLEEDWSAQPAANLLADLVGSRLRRAGAAVPAEIADRAATILERRAGRG